MSSLCIASCVVICGTAGDSIFSHTWQEAALLRSKEVGIVARSRMQLAGVLYSTA